MLLDKKWKHMQGIAQTKDNTLFQYGLHSTTLSRMIQKLQSSENYELNRPSTSTCPTIHTISVEQECDNYFSGILEAKTEMILPQSMVHFTSIIDMQTDTKM